MPPPDPSQPNQFEQRVRDLVNQMLSDPMNYPDPMVSWFEDKITLSLPTVDSTSGFDTSHPSA